MGTLFPALASWGTSRRHFPRTLVHGLATVENFTESLPRDEPAGNGTVEPAGNRAEGNRHRHGVRVLHMQPVIPGASTAPWQLLQLTSLSAEHLGEVPPDTFARRREQVHPSQLVSRRWKHYRAVPASNS